MKAGGNGERAPLRTVLQNFLNHVETLEKRKNGGDDQYDKEFQELKILSESLKGLQLYSCKEGEKEVNRRKNRYKDILPFDCTRVILSEIAGIPGSDYINANYIRGASGSQAYIASQGPLVHTVTDFWRMVVECDVQVIIMACNEEESGKHKCECYWADSDQETKSYGPYTVKLLKSRRMCNDFNLRTMELIYVNSTGETITRTVVQFHYWAWPDHGVPALVRPLLDMVRLIRDCQASETLPLLIHCSAGCGRTGTICAIDYVWGLLRAGKLMENFSLFELISDMRRQRVAMVQTKDQYILVHRALRELFIEQLKMIDAHPYENLDVNGHPLICPPQDIRIDPSYETIFVKVNPTVVSEVNEEDDVCHEEPIDQIPWPVLQYQSNLAAINSAPPLPDKKKKTGGTSEQGSPISSPSDIKKTVSNVSSESSSKESSPPTSLERLLLKPSDAEASNESLKEEEEAVKQKSSPKSGLSRKSSILKIRAFFEKSHSEPRSEKKSKSFGASTRKASSFRLREGPKFYRSLEYDHARPLGESENTRKDPSEFVTSQKLTVAQGTTLDDVDTVPSIETVDWPLSNTGGKADEKPSLPVKRSKSMKVYRGFDIRSETSKQPNQHEDLVATREVVAPATCGVVLSKTPSVTYISSKDKLCAENTIEIVRKNATDDDRSVNHKKCLPLATSSLDRGKEQRFTKPTTSLSGTPTCGSLDRGVVSVAENKVIPTYVNVLMRNQEAANTSKLDNDTRQLLHDCQAYLMDGDGSELMPREEKHQRSTPHVKKHKSRPLKERRHSFKNAVVQHPDQLQEFDLLTSSLTRETEEENYENYAILASFEMAMKAEDAEAAKSRNGRKIHEYEAIWLSSKEPAACAVEPELVEENQDSDGGVDSKDSVFVQKSDEIRLLLSELRNAPSDEPKQSSPVVPPNPAYNFLSHSENLTSPRLHPDRVLSELQELVERANRNKEEAIKSEAILLSVPSVLQRVSPTSPSVHRNPLRHNLQLPVSRADIPSPASPSSAQFFPAAPSSISNTPSPGLISPIPIKISPSAPSSPIASAYSATAGPYRSSPNSNDATQQSIPLSISATRISPKVDQQSIPSSTKTEPKAPAFRPPPPYPTKFYVKMPSVSKETTAIASTSTINPIKLSPQVQRRMPPEYKAPPPVKPTTQSKASQPIAPPRSKRQVTSTSQLPTMVAFPKGPPIPTRSFSSSSVPGIDVDAVAAVMAAAENSSNRGNSTGGSSSPTTAANKALSKALGKFHATAASFKTKFAQLSDGKDGGGEPSAISTSQSKLERESSFVKPTVDGVSMNTAEATSYARKKQQYL